MPYTDRDKDRAWHRDYMRKRRAIIKDIPAACDRLEKALGMPAVVAVTPEPNVTPVTPKALDFVTPKQDITIIDEPPCITPNVNKAFRRLTKERQVKGFNKR